MDRHERVILEKLREARKMRGKMDPAGYVIRDESPSGRWQYWNGREWTPYIDRAKIWKNINVAMKTYTKVRLTDIGSVVSVTVAKQEESNDGPLMKKLHEEQAEDAVKQYGPGVRKFFDDIKKSGSKVQRDVLKYHGQMVNILLKKKLVPDVGTGNLMATWYLTGKVRSFMRKLRQEPWMPVFKKAFGA